VDGGGGDRRGPHVRGVRRRRRGCGIRGGRGVSGSEGKGSEVSGARGAAADRSRLRSEDGSHGRRQNRIATEVKKLPRD
jgi:hypothetical protein